MSARNKDSANIGDGANMLHMLRFKSEVRTIENKISKVHGYSCSHGILFTIKSEFISQFIHSYSKVYPYQAPDSRRFATIG